MITIRRWIVAGFVFSILAGASGAQEKAPNALRVDEARIQFHLLPNPVLEFAVFNPTDKPVAGSFAIELLDRSDRVSVTLRNVSGAAGRNGGKTGGARGKVA